MNLKVRDIIRDVSFLFFLTYWSGYILRRLSFIFDFDVSDIMFVAVNYITVLTGLCFVAVWINQKRFQHLYRVGILLWFVGFPNAYHSFPNFFFRNIAISGTAVAVSIFLSWAIANKIDAMKRDKN